MGIQQKLIDLFEEAGATAHLHVRPVGAPSSAAVEVDASTPFPLASVAKVVVATAFARSVAAGAVDPTERVDVPHDVRVGGLALGSCRDDVTMSLRDLAWMMLCVSDNPSFDVLLERVGQQAVDELIADLGLVHTSVDRSMASTYRAAAAELGRPGATDADAVIAGAGDAAAGSSLLDLATTNSSTAAEIGELLDAIWTDRAGPREACDFVRSAMRLQATNHRLAAGFADDVAVASKTGTFPFVRSDAGVVEHPDGSAHVVVVFTRAADASTRQPMIDAAIGAAARLTVDHLRLSSAGRA